MEHYQNIFGIGPWEIINVDPSIVSDMTYHCRPVQHRFSAALSGATLVALEEDSHVPAYAGP
jgi:hypothetical protein